MAASPSQHAKHQCWIQSRSALGDLKISGSPPPKILYQRVLIISELGTWTYVFGGHHDLGTQEGCLRLTQPVCVILHPKPADCHAPAQRPQASAALGLSGSSSARGRRASLAGRRAVRMVLWGSTSCWDTAGSLPPEDTRDTAPPADLAVPRNKKEPTHPGAPLASQDRRPLALGVRTGHVAVPLRELGPHKRQWDLPGDGRSAELECPLPLKNMQRLPGGSYYKNHLCAGNRFMGGEDSLGRHSHPLLVLFLEKSMKVKSSGWRSIGACQ